MGGGALLGLHWGLIGASLEPHRILTGDPLGPHWGPNEVLLGPQWGPRGLNEAPKGPMRPFGAPMGLTGASIWPYWSLNGAPLGAQ